VKAVSANIKTNDRHLTDDVPMDEDEGGGLFVVDEELSTDEYQAGFDQANIILGRSASMGPVYGSVHIPSLKTLIGDLVSLDEHQHKPPSVVVDSFTKVSSSYLIEFQLNLLLILVDRRS